MDFIRQINATDHYEIQSLLDKKHDGECPCFWATKVIDGKKISIHGHCWRVCMECSYNGLHVSGKLLKKDLMRIARALKRKLDKQKWYSPYEIHLKERTK